LLVLLGLPGLYAAQRGRMGRLGLVGFLTAFAGTYLIAVTGNFGFLAPVLAKQSPAVLDSVNQYMPVVIINGLAAILFMIGYVLFGVAMIRTAALPRWSGVLVAVGAPAHLLGFGIAALAAPRSYAVVHVNQGLATLTVAAKQAKSISMTLSRNLGLVDESSASRLTGIELTPDLTAIASLAVLITSNPCSNFSALSEWAKKWSNSVPPFATFTLPEIDPSDCDPGSSHCCTSAESFTWIT
jgi:hypothetical protein